MVGTSNNKASKYMEQKLTELKRKYILVYKTSHMPIKK